MAAYHSATSERGEAYRARVYAAWNPAVAAKLPGPLAAPARLAGPVVIRIAGPDLSGPDSPIRVWTPARRGSAPALIVMPAPGLVPGMLVVASGPAGGDEPADASRSLPHAAMVPAALGLPAPGRPAPGRPAGSP